MPLHRRIYRFLLRLYPARFREEYGRPLELQFSDEYREASGVIERLRLWLRVGFDLLISLPIQVTGEAAGDMRHAIRAYSRRPFVTALAVVGLALAIGTTTGIFSVFNALFLRTLPYREPDRIVQVFPPGYGVGTSPGFHRWRKGVPYLDDAANYDQVDMDLVTASGASRVTVTESSSNFFDMIGVKPELGRSFAPGEDVPGADAVVVISHGLAQQLFGTDRRAIGGSVRLGGQAQTVIGVAPAWFDYPPKTQAWTPTAFDYKRLAKSGAWGIETVGRLKQGMSAATATALYRAEVSREDPEALARPGQQPGVTPLLDELAGPVRQATLVLVGIVAFVLTIACANVAQLLLTEVTERRTELTVRSALGASPARLRQQLIAESLLVALLSALAGLGVAHLVCNVMAVAVPPKLAWQRYDLLDSRVIAFALGLTLATAILFGVLPATAAGRSHPFDALRTQPNGRRGVSGRARHVLLGAQLTLTVALMAGSIAMVGGFSRLLQLDLGFIPAHVVTLDVSVAGTRDNDQNQRRAYFREALARLRSAPNVISAGAVNHLPLTRAMYGASHYRTEDGRLVAGDALMIWASEDYFKTMGTELLAGREFNEADGAGAARVAIVNEVFAHAAGGMGALLGRRITDAHSNKESYTVIGVTRTISSHGPGERLSPQVFFSSEQFPASKMTLVARVRGSASDSLPVLRDLVRSIDRQVPVFNVRTLQARLDEHLARQRFFTTVVLFLGGFALLLSVLGIYAVSWHSVSQRSHEIGVRVAMGASLAGIYAMTVRQSAVPLVTGLAAGVGLAVWSGRFLSHLLTGVTAIGTPSCLVAAGMLALVAIAAMVLATRRVTGRDPLVVLRSE